MKKKFLFFLLGLSIFSLTTFIATTEVTGEEGVAFKGKINAENVKLRAGYNEHFASLKNLKKGEDLIVLDRYFCWYQVKLPYDVYCYASKTYINDEGFVTADQLNVRAGAGEKYYILGKLKKGEPVFIVSSEGDWYKIRPPEAARGWVHEDYLDKISEISTADIPKATVLQNDNISSKEIIDYDKLPKIETDTLENYTTVGLKTIIVAYHNFSITHPNSRYKDELELKLNLLNLQLKNKQEQIIPTIDGRNISQDSIHEIGTLRDLGRVYGTAATHKLKIKGRTKYYLNSSTIDLDDYIYKKVKIQGLIEDNNSKYPLINIKQVEVLD